VETPRPRRADDRERGPGRWPTPPTPRSRQLFVAETGEDHVGHVLQKLRLRDRARPWSSPTSPASSVPAPPGSALLWGRPEPFPGGRRTAPPSVVVQEPRWKGTGRTANAPRPRGRLAAIVARRLTSGSGR
jgi:hypothetical protein